jgi:hypothetical protein
MKSKMMRCLDTSRTKNQRELFLRLPRQAVALLANLPHTNEWVFGGRLTNWDRATKIIQTDSKTQNWHRHDLRRTVATCFGRLGKSPYLSEALLNHAELHSKLSRIYNKATYHAEVAEALQEWADALDAVIAGDADIIERLKR